jgi:hypothetical protein
MRTESEQMEAKGKYRKMGICPKRTGFLVGRGGKG